MPPGLGPSESEALRRQQITVAYCLVTASSHIYRARTCQRSYSDSPESQLVRPAGQPSGPWPTGTDRATGPGGGSAAAGARTVMKSTTLVMPVRLMIARLANCRGPAVGHVASRHLVRLGACGRQFTPEAKSFVMQIPAPERHLYPAGQSLSTFSSVMDFTVVLARIPGLLECALVQKFKTYHGNLKLLPDPRP